MKKSTIIGSLHKIIANSQLYHSQPSETKDQHHYLHLTILTVTLIASQIIFSILVSQSIFIYHPEEENYLISSIFWSAFALPYLFEHFYLSEVLYHDNPKQNFQFFPYIILAFMLETLFEGTFFLIFIVLKLLNIYIQVKQGYYMLHINFVINSTLLIFTIFYVLLKF